MNKINRLEWIKTSSFCFISSKWLHRRLTQQSRRKMNNSWSVSRSTGACVWPAKKTNEKSIKKLCDFLIIRKKKRASLTVRKMKLSRKLFLTEFQIKIETRSAQCDSDFALFLFVRINNLARIFKENKKKPRRMQQIEFVCDFFLFCCLNLFIFARLKSCKWD
jgi:hypothetical protein